MFLSFGSLVLPGRPTELDLPYLVGEPGVSGLLPGRILHSRFDSGNGFHTPLWF